MHVDSSWSLKSSGNSNSTDSSYIFSALKLKFEGNLHDPDFYLASHEFQVDLLCALDIRIHTEMNTYAVSHHIGFLDDSYTTFSTDGFPTWRKVALCVVDSEDNCEEYFYQFNSAGSFEVSGSKHPLEVHPLISEAYQVCIERRCGYIRDSDLISMVKDDQDINSTIKDRKG